MSFYTEISHLQDLVNNIYTKENERVQLRKQGINDMISSQKRLVALNQSYASKMKKYAFIIGIIAFALVFTVMIIVFRSLIPTILADISIVVVVAGSLIWCYLIFIDIQKRDQIDFDELASNSSALVNPANIEQRDIAAGNAGDISALESNLISSAGCIGQQCCPTLWTGVLPGGMYYNSNFISIFI
jgi:hypothetical protein